MVAGPQSAASIHLAETDAALPVGGQERLSLKAWLNDGTVLWEIRRLVFFQVTHEYTKAFDLSSWMSHHKAANLFPRRCIATTSSRAAVRLSAAAGATNHCFARGSTP